ncbi:hypothetical protein F1D05_14365 [Kribbella qitaiheensis]|uniref:Recombinase family protein n=1 Tax=Kribbella qitaiheensis TaxID=1544730 RepID=A0A7G6WY10_9ACTN|nr:hypothetical protein [Kribbella qitaiheensis]QNE18875.1 hypothetical protein F1D05_14365 [Kribbella qitaiheensis]
MKTIGYFKKSFLMTSREIAQMRQLIANCAAAHDRTLDALYIDEIDTAPVELFACITDAMEHDDMMLIIPNLLHLAGEGDPHRLRMHLESGGIVVLIAQQPSQAGRACRAG